MRLNHDPFFSCKNMNIHPGSGMVEHSGLDEKTMATIVSSKFIPLPRETEIHGHLPEQWVQESEHPSVSQVVTNILNHPVDLHRLQGIGAEGQSGCTIYFAHDSHEAGQVLAVAKVFPQTCRSDFLDELASHHRLRSLDQPPAAARVLGTGRCYDETMGPSSPWQDVTVYELAPGVAINSLIRDAGRLTTLRGIAQLARQDGRLRQDLEDLIFNELAQGMGMDGCASGCGDRNGKAYTRSGLCHELQRRFDHLMTELIHSVQAVAAMLATLHRVQGEWSEAGESVLERIRSKLLSWMHEIQGPSRSVYIKAIGADGVERLDALVQRAIEESRHDGIASLLHGDASSGNFFWHSVQGITMIDYGGLAHSIDAAGRPTGPAEMDAAGFYERLRKYAGNFGMKESDIGLVQAAFWKAYQAQGLSVNEGIVQLFRARTQLSRIRSAVAKLDDAGDDERYQAQLRAKVEFEWNYFLGIFPEVTRPSRVLFVANMSGPGKGGLPLLNQELVQAMSKLPNASVTLLVVKSDDEEDQVHSAHGQAKVVYISSGQCNPSALLYQVAKICQPGDLGLPTSYCHDDTLFDLIIGHSRYSSAAASLIRERWYPAAKLALITHTSALRKSDAAWTWYGTTRESGYVEAARLAMLDEKTLPKADLAVGVGPILTAEAREREWMGQYSQQRATETGPRFHELVPGASVHVCDQMQSQRGPDDILRVLLPGRADDPAKGLDDAVYAVYKVASQGHRIVLHVLGVPAEDVDTWQHDIDKVTGMPGLIRMHPFCSDRFTVLKHYRNTDLVIMPSTHEGFGMIFTEAAGLAIPILVTQDSGAGQLALDRTRFPADVGQSCVVMDESAYGITPSPESERVMIWANRIDQVRRQPDQARQHARALREIMRGYSWTHAAMALLSAAMESSTDTVQMSGGTIASTMQSSHSPSLSPGVVAAMRRASQTRNRSGTPDPQLADEVLHSLPEIEPTMAGLEQHVSAVVGCPIRLGSMDTMHPQGFSGAVIFFAYADESSTAMEKLSILPTETAKGHVVAVLKLFTHGLDNGISEELSSLEWLLLQAKGDIETAAPLAFGQTRWEDKAAGTVTYKPAQGVSLYHIMMKLGPMPSGPGRASLLAVLKRGAQEVARTLARLHLHSREGKSSLDYLEWYFNALELRVKQMYQHGEILRSQGLNVDQLSANMQRLRTDCQCDMERNPRTTVVHGDAHPGNFFYEQATGQVTVIDLTTLHCSLDKNGEPTGAPERDLGHFVHMLRRTGEQYGMSRLEMDECTTAFMDAYLVQGNTAVNIPTVRLLMVCSALSFLNRSSQAEGPDLGQQVKILQDILCFGEK